MARVLANLADYRALAERDTRNIAGLRAELRTDRVIEVPYLAEDVHDLEGLFELNRYLFGQPEAGG